MLDPATSESQPSEAVGFAGDLGLRHSRPAPEVAVLSVQGEIDALTTPQLTAGIDELLTAVAERFVIDLSAVTFLASGGLAALIRTAQLTEERGHRLRLVAVTRAVLRPLQITGSDQLFDLFDDLDTATGAPV